MCNRSEIFWPDKSGNTTKIKQWAHETFYTEYERTEKLTTRPLLQIKDLRPTAIWTNRANDEIIES